MAFVFGVEFGLCCNVDLDIMKCVYGIKDQPLLPIEKPASLNKRAWVPMVSLGDVATLGPSKLPPSLGWKKLT